MKKDKIYEAYKKIMTKENGNILKIKNQEYIYDGNNRIIKIKHIKTGMEFNFPLEDVVELLINKNNIHNITKRRMKEKK